MRAELISIETNTYPLDGAYYEPNAGEITGSVLLFHGNTMNFYVGAPRFLPPVLTELGLACLSFNRRGHDVLSTRNSRDLEGGAYQTSAEAIADNIYAADWLSAKGYGTPVLIGHSNGGMLAVKHAADHPKTPALVLLSAHAGGRDITKLMSKYGLWGKGDLQEIKAVAEGKQPKDLLLLPGWWNAISAESALDVFNNVPGILENAPKITCPVLYLKGNDEPDDLYPTKAFQEKCSGPCDVEILDGCDHFYNGFEDKVAEIIAAWLSERI
ncbi:MAG: alpha/beta hydrolase [Rhodospirillales bacterium]